MAWKNHPIKLYHGTDQSSAETIVRDGIDLDKCKPFTDFGVGFYTTTNLAQAKNWANSRIQRLGAGGDQKVRAAIVPFVSDRVLLAGLKTLTFVRDDPDYWEFVKYCREGRSLHGPGGTQYDLVSGPVSLWKQTLIISNCDQFSFHTKAGLKALGPAGRVSLAPPKGKGLFRTLK